MKAIKLRLSGNYYIGEGSVKTKLPKQHNIHGLRRYVRKSKMISQCQR